MIDLDALRERLHDQRRMLPGAVSIDIGVGELDELLEEVARLRAENQLLQNAILSANDDRDATAERLATLTALGRQVVEEAQKGCSIHEVWDKLEAALKALKAEINKEGV